ncbi:FIG00925943: hypothetical protein, partial [hydrothermal vent metagenome]
MSWFPSRRDFMHVGFLGGLGITLGDFFRLKKAEADRKNFESKEGTAKQVIFIYLPGGASHQEMWDPKPNAPIEYRGPMSSIKTNVAGVRLNETLKKTAQVMDKITICRSMTHGEAAHERGTHNMFTGYRPNPALKFPSMGSVVTHEFGPRNHLPQYVCIPNQPNEFAGTGYLSSTFAPFSLGADPARKGYRVRDLTLPRGVDSVRFSRRRGLLDTVNEHFASTEKSDALDSVDSFYQRAYAMVSSQKAREAFDLEKESSKTRDAYGRNIAGSRMLLARRLVEAGVRFTTMTYGSWDMHDKVQDRITKSAPAFDQAFAALITDLDQRGMLESTLVCVASEFGRTPKINKTSGRDHWAKVFSVVLAGGGVKQGFVYGSSNATASEPENNPLSVPSWASTIYHCLGIVGEKE